MPIKEFLGFKIGNVGSTTQHPENLGEGEPISPLSTAQHIDERPKTEKPLPLRALLTRKVIIAVGNYASLSLVDISLRAIQPVFLSTPIHLGGLGLPPSTIGNLLAIFGILNGVFQIFFFARINDRWGPKRVFFWGAASGIPVFASFPVINYLARHNGYCTTVWIVVGFQIVISIALSLSFGQYFCFVLFRVALALTLSLPSQALASFSLSTRHPIGPLLERLTV